MLKVVPQITDSGVTSPVPLVHSLPATGTACYAMEVLRAGLTTRLRAESADDRVLGFSRTVRSERVANVLTPMSIPTPSPWCLGSGAVLVSAPIAAYQRMPSLLTTTVVISPSNLISLYVGFDMYNDLFEVERGAVDRHLLGHSETDRKSGSPHLFLMEPEQLPGPTEPASCKDGPVFKGDAHGTARDLCRH